MKNVEYNIGGIGVLNVNLYPLNSQLLEEKYLNAEFRLKQTNQLGAIRHMHNGARFNRFEYVLLQSQLINFLKEKEQFGFNSDVNINELDLSDEFTYDDSISNAEYIQLFVLFGNIGYFPDTFATNKVLLHILRENKFNIKNNFKKGLSSRSKKLFDQIVDNGDYHKIQWLITLFMTNRRKTLKNYNLLAEQILNKIINDNNDERVDIYNKIRLISFIILDTHYAQIPISISLHNILLEKDFLSDEINKFISGFIESFEAIKDVLEDTLYLENNTTIMATQTSYGLYNKIYSLFNTLENIGVKEIEEKLVDANSSVFYERSSLLEESPQISWDDVKNLSLTFKVRDISGFPKDLFSKELSLKDKLGKDVFLSFNYNPDYSKYRAVFALRKELEGENKLKKVLEIINLALSEFEQYREYSSDKVKNGELNEVLLKKLITYLFRNVLNDDYFCRYEDIKIDKSPIFFETGSKNALMKVRDYIKAYRNEDYMDKDVLHELESVEYALEDLDYKGRIIVYLGSLTFKDKDRNTVCELDGVIIMPNRSDWLWVVEAKKPKPRGSASRIAKEQMEQKLIPLFSDTISGCENIYDLPRYGSLCCVKT